VNFVSHTIVENLKQFAFKADKSRVVRRTLWLIKVVPTWKKFEKRWFRLYLSYVIYTVRPCLIHTCLSHAVPLPCHKYAVLKATSQAHGASRHGNGMVCVNSIGRPETACGRPARLRRMAGKWQGRGRGTAWEQHGMSELAFNAAGELQGNGMGTA
jgi:hypothetical protein